MMTDNDNQQRQPEEGDNAARRDGERSRNEGYTSNPWRKPTEGRGQNSFDRPRRSFSDNKGDFARNGFGGDRPRRSFSGDNDRPRRPYGEGCFDRPRRSFDGDGNRFDASSDNNRFDRPRRSYEDNGSRFGEGGSRYNASQEGSFNRPRRTQGEGGFDRPRRSSGEGGFDRPFRPQGEGSFNRPRRPMGDGGFDRPHRSFEGEGNRFGGDGNRFGGEGGNRFGGEGGNRFGGENKRFGDRGNRFGNDGNRFGGSREGGYDRPRRPFGEGRPSFGGPTLPKPDRADGRPRRPRIKKEGSFDHGTPYGRPTSYQPNLDPDVPIRLNKYLANAGICSRREADEFIQAGVVKVNGEVVSELGVKVKPTDTIMFHDQTVSIERKVYILLNKPKDCVTTSDDPEERLTVMDLVKGACYERIYPVGRLDRNTTGVLLLTNDGDLASKLTHPKFEKRKIYQVTLDRNLAEADFKTIQAGVTLDEEPITVDNLSYVDPDKANVVGIEIHSGQNRVVRRIFESLNYKVFKLDRVYFAGLTKKNLPRGKWRHLSEKEVSLLKMGAFV